MPNTNYYQAKPQKPAHLSVGVVLLDEAKQVICHFYPKLGDYSDIYVLMTETIEMGETLEQTLHRGLKEEFGASATVISYIGSIITLYPWFKEQINVQKTTVYFLAKLTNLNEKIRLNDHPSYRSEIVYKDIDFLIDKMSSTFLQYKVPDFDASSILEKVKLYLNNNNV